MKTATLVAIVLGVLVLIAVVQAFQLTELKSDVKEGQLTVSSSGGGATPSTGTARTAALPSSVKDLPQMVGGC